MFKTQEGYLKCLSFQILCIAPVSPRVPHSPSSRALRQETTMSQNSYPEKTAFPSSRQPWGHCPKGHCPRGGTDTLTCSHKRENTPSSVELRSSQSVPKYHQWYLRLWRLLVFPGISASLTATGHWYPALNYCWDNTQSYKLSVFTFRVCYSSLHFNSLFLKWDWFSFSLINWFTLLWST